MRKEERGENVRAQACVESLLALQAAVNRDNNLSVCCPAPCDSDRASASSFSFVLQKD